MLRRIVGRAGTDCTASAQEAARPGRRRVAAPCAATWRATTRRDELVVGRARRQRQRQRQVRRRLLERICAQRAQGCFCDAGLGLRKVEALGRRGSSRRPSAGGWRAVGPCSARQRSISKGGGLPHTYGVCLVCRRTWRNQRAQPRLAKASVSLLINLRVARQPFCISPTSLLRKRRRMLARAASRNGTQCANAARS